MFGAIHNLVVRKRRAQKLADLCSELLPESGRLLEVGCGLGELAHKVSLARPGLELHGIDVLVREQTQFPVQEFDGSHIPHDADSFDAVLFVDVLHHTEDPMLLLREARRVSRRFIVIKDHLLEGLGAGPTLRFMDWVGNARYGVALPYNYWPRDRWLSAFAELDLVIEQWHRPKLYPWLPGLVFDRSLHFITLLSVGGA